MPQTAQSLGQLWASPASQLLLPQVLGVTTKRWTTKGLRMVTAAGSARSVAS